MYSIMEAFNSLRRRPTNLHVDATIDISDENIDVTEQHNYENTEYIYGKPSPLSAPEEGYITPPRSPTTTPPAPPQLHHPSLRRDINVQKWNTGFKNFTKLNSEYQTWKVLTIMLPFYIISVSVSTIQYFTRDEFYWFCFYLPLFSTITMYYLYTSLYFSNATRLSYTKLSYYPGIPYEYGYIIHSVFSRDDNTYCQYQYWVVMNPRTNDVNFLCVTHGDYHHPTRYDIMIC